MSGARDTPKPFSKARIGRRIVKSEFGTQTFQGGRREAREVRKVGHLLFGRIGVGGSETSGESTTHGVTIHQHMNFGHGKSILGFLFEKLLEFVTNHVKRIGLSAGFSGPNELHVVLIASNNGLEKRKNKQEKQSWVTHEILPLESLCHCIELVSVTLYYLPHPKAPSFQQGMDLGTA